MHPIQASEPFTRAVEAIDELLSKLRLAHVFVGNIARSAWLGGPADGGSVDVLAVMGPQQKNQIAMMAHNRGFRVEREEIDAAEELDLIPVNFIHPDGDVRVHVLVASNALYAKMVTHGVSADLGARQITISSAEDLALLLAVSGDDEAVRSLASMEAFDRGGYNSTLRSIGLGALEL